MGASKNQATDDNNSVRGSSLTFGMTQVFPEAKKIGVVLLTTNGGLVGSLNTNLLNMIKKEILRSAQDDKIEIDFVTYGKKGSQAIVRMSMQIMADFAKNDRYTHAEDIFPIAQVVAQKYATGEYQKIYLAYNHFYSTLSQKPELKQLLPFSTPSSPGKEKMPARADEVETREHLISNSSPQGEEEGSATEFLFEPTPEIVLNHLLPRIIESQIYEAVLESNASEHSARMVMMKNATESAGDLIADYTLTYNQLRQGKITTELAEITAGKIALE
jgi:F-type H+-transporting ATPase subunit gamma